MGFLSQIADIWHGGGYIMYIILAGLLFTIAFIIERAVYLRKASVDKDKLIQLLRSQVSNGNIQGAIKACSGNPAPLTRIVQAGLMKFNRSDEEVQAAMDEAALRELPRLQQRTPYLATLSNFSVLAGLLGTIWGMIRAFGAVGGPEEGATELAEGIAIALHSTLFGIFSSTWGLIGFAVLSGKTTRLIDDINEVTVQVVNLVTSHRQQMQQPGGAAPA